MSVVVRTASPEGAVSEMDEPKAKIVEEFRANEGRVGGQFEGAPSSCSITADGAAARTTSHR